MFTSGVCQFLYTAIQDHAVWESLSFWRSQFRSAVQNELFLVYKNFPRGSPKARKNGVIYPKDTDGDGWIVAPRRRSSSIVGLSSEGIKNVRDRPSNVDVLRLVADRVCTIITCIGSTFIVFSLTQDKAMAHVLRRREDRLDDARRGGDLRPMHSIRVAHDMAADAARRRVGNARRWRWRTKRRHRARKRPVLETGSRSEFRSAVLQRNLGRSEHAAVARRATAGNCFGYA